MKPPAGMPAAPAPGELTAMQLEVARRADRLARRELPGAAARDRRLWLRAECEVFEVLEVAENSGLRSPARIGATGSVTAP